MKSANKFSPMFSSRSVRLAVVSTCLLALVIFTNVNALQTAAVGRNVTQIKFSTLDGQQLSLAGLRGKVVVLDFFGIRCVHSRDHVIQTMNRYTREDFTKGLQIIGLESESSSLDQVRQYVKDQQIIYPVAQIDESTFIQLINSRDLSAPQTLVFGRDGKLLLHTNGHSAKNEADIQAAIQKAL